MGPVQNGASPGPVPGGWTELPVQSTLRTGLGPFSPPLRTGPIISVQFSPYPRTELDWTVGNADGIHLGGVYCISKKCWKLTLIHKSRVSGLVSIKGHVALHSQINRHRHQRGSFKRVDKDSGVSEDGDPPVGNKTRYNALNLRLESLRSEVIVKDM